MAAHSISRASTATTAITANKLIPSIVCASRPSKRSTSGAASRYMPDPSSGCGFASTPIAAWSAWAKPIRIPKPRKPWCMRSLAPVLLGRDPSQIDRLWADMFQAVSFSGWAGAEMRAISAVDIALWDLAGKAANHARLPVARRRVARFHPHLQHLLRPHRFPDRARAPGAASWPNPESTP